MTCHRVPSAEDGWERIRCSANQRARGTPSQSTRLLLLLALLACLFLPLTGASAQTKKPRVPIGIDPGGVLIAIAAVTGIDYTQKDISDRLARDGEGELIGWDFVDDDRQPFAAAAAGTAATDLARAVLSQAPGSRLAVFRSKNGDKITLGKLAVYAARSRSRILLLTIASGERSEWEAFAEVVAHFKEMLVIVPADAGTASFPAALGLPNILSVSVGPASGQPAPSPFQPDLTIAPDAGGSHAAAARIAALAAGIAAAETASDGARLKQRLLAMARSGLANTPRPAPAPSPLSLPPASPR